MKRQNNQKGSGAVFGIIIVVIVLIGGAIYFYNQSQVRQQEIQSLNDQATTTDDVASLDAEAAAMNFDNLDAGVDQL